jgi:2-iminobutanoate/2-iminopropanoate deaminase
MPKVETSTPPHTPPPIGPYSHIAKVGSFITIGGVAGFDPATGELAGSDIAAQARQILTSFKTMLASVNSDLDHVVHINIFLREMSDFEAMNAAYVEVMGSHRPARTVIGVGELPKPRLRLTMNLTAVTRD